MKVIDKRTDEEKKKTTPVVEFCDLAVFELFRYPDAPDFVYKKASIRTAYLWDAHISRWKKAMSPQVQWDVTPIPSELHIIGEKP